MLEGGPKAGNCLVTAFRHSTNSRGSMIMFPFEEQALEIIFDPAKKLLDLVKWVYPPSLKEVHGKLCPFKIATIHSIKQSSFTGVRPWHLQFGRSDRRWRAVLDAAEAAATSGASASPSNRQY